MAAKREQQLRLADALEQLPEDYRQVIMLRNIEDLSHEEVASRMQRTPGAVRMLWLRALAALREQLAAHKELAGKLAELENRITGHDEALQNLFEAIRQLIEPPLPEDRPKIGFHLRETSPPFRVKTRSRM